MPSAHMLLVAFACCLALCSAAAEFYIAEQMVDSADDSPLKSGILLVDLRPPPVPPNPKAWTLATEKDALQRRGLKVEGEDQDESTSASPSAHQTTAAAAHHTTASSATKSSPSTSRSSASMATQSSQPASSPLPTPFDQGFAGNITESCSNFVYGFLADQTFTSCLPFSLLLQVCLEF